MSSVLATTHSGMPLSLAREDRAPLGTFDRFLLGAIVLEIPIQLDMSLFYEARWGDVGAIGGLTLSLTTVCLAVLYARWLLLSAASLTRASKPRLYFSLPLSAYMGMVAISVLSAQDKKLAYCGIAMLVHAYLIFTYVANRVATRSDVMLVVTMLLVSLALQSMFLIGIFFVGHEVMIGPLTFSIMTDGRVGGTLVTPNAAASYLELLIAPALAVLVTPLGRPAKWLAVGALGLSTLALYLTFSRGGWLATGLSLVFFCAFAWQRRWISTWLPVALFAAALLALAVKFETVAKRIVSNDEGAVTTRFALMEMGQEIIAEHPLTGVGVNNYASTAFNYARQVEYRGEWFHTIHNKYLLEWAELGVFGLAAFVWFLLSILRTGWKAWQKQDSVLAPIALGLAVAIGGQMVHMFADIFAGRPQVQTLWLCAGLVTAIYRVPGSG